MEKWERAQNVRTRRPPPLPRMHAPWAAASLLAHAPTARAPPVSPQRPPPDGVVSPARGNEAQAASPGSGRHCAGAAREHDAGPRSMVAPQARCGRGARAGHLRAGQGGDRPRAHELPALECERGRRPLHGVQLRPRALRPGAPARALARGRAPPRLGARGICAVCVPCCAAGHSWSWVRCERCVTGHAGQPTAEHAQGRRAWHAPCCCIARPNRRSSGLTRAQAKALRAEDFGQLFSIQAFGSLTYRRAPPPCSRVPEHAAASARLRGVPVAWSRLLQRGRRTLPAHVGRMLRGLAEGAGRAQVRPEGRRGRARGELLLAGRQHVVLLPAGRGRPGARVLGVWPARGPPRAAAAPPARPPPAGAPAPGMLRRRALSVSIALPPFRAAGAVAQLCLCPSGPRQVVECAQVAAGPAINQGKG